mgnify:CR=1 FL=1
MPLTKNINIVLDCAKDAEYYHIPFGRICDPLLGVHRCYALVPLALSKGRLYSFCHSIAQGVWAEALNVQCDTDLEYMVTRSGLDWTEAKNYVSSSHAITNSEEWYQLVANNRNELL